MRKKTMKKKERFICMAKKKFKNRQCEWKFYGKNKRDSKTKSKWNNIAH